VWRGLAQIGRMHAIRDAAAEGLARLRPVLPALAEAAPSRGAAMLLVAMTWLFLADDQYQASVAMAERAAQVARILGDDALLADVEVRRGRALIELGRLNEARQVLEAALPLAEAVPGDDVLLRLLNADAVIYKQQGAFDRCRHCLDRVLAEAATVDSTMDAQGSGR
jgi:tetratricopeptide (TPR) repeat protein